MFREIRRIKKKLPESEAVRMLEQLSCCTLALSGDDGYTYSVPVSFVYDNGKIFFHSATEGKKCDSILQNNKISFSAVEKDDIKPAEFTTHYKSVIGFGEITLLEKREEIQHAMELILKKYSPDYMKEGKDYIERAWGHFYTYVIDIHHMTAKGTEKQKE
ncbi:Predicted flavin-nucleotide-binding protein [Sebaldella termitidis]|jgi:nitroimidazol reductase NimA-like FMN-containing flavoprotein (pyridoxamine 5'-phosphate oxidase superfamily)|uniref:Pyridoxamine 5'-phosphate oxidase-related FMN-binding protein n=1 Tax=Sebaldella termitidis (strain ATCC 33386 / NCTC 11300) TaxID=526218 RepID=D1ALT8_SEBTE|nr:pyridoxamine 5'-phosphate oxidase family protein [Sebaldella termitidis]ACZ07206.1 pyridoxamine 5'-phosphate oxidase-related FMN- binding protein [Sebaldella termitidis ATCC 33386]SUI22497.1 Predicted flavin-nucleotide-binding protein [Sebaldella termitidis]